MPCGRVRLDLVGEFSHYAQEDTKLEGAAAALVAKSDVKAALGVDVNGAPRRAAVLANVDFLKPPTGRCHVMESFQQRHLASR